MTEFQVLRTNHTSFTVSDLDRSIAFFRDALGFDVTARTSRDPALSQSITGVDGAHLDVAYARGPDTAWSSFNTEPRITGGKLSPVRATRDLPISRSMSTI